MSGYPISKPASRFHVCCEHCHFIEATYNKTEAATIAAAHEHDGHAMTVYDSMARRGQVQLWKLTPHGNLSGIERRPRDA